MSVRPITDGPLRGRPSDACPPPRAAVPPASRVRALVDAAACAIGRQVGHARGPVAALVVASGLGWPLAGAAPVAALAGVRCALLPWGAVAGLARELVPTGDARARRLPGGGPRVVPGALGGRVA